MNKRRIKVNIISKIILLLVLFISVFINIDSVKAQNFKYSGYVQQFTVPESGIYKLEVWGAQGGDASAAGVDNPGGYGGYSVGFVQLTQGQTIYVVVGGEGVDNVTKLTNGGYNGGGGRGFNAGTEYLVGTGGGATHIATATGLLYDLGNQKTSVLIVAGGGGGSSIHTSGVSASSGGNGGGGLGNSGGDRVENPYTWLGSKGGSQTAGGQGDVSGGFGGGGSSFSAGGGGYYGGGASGSNGNTSRYSYTGGGGGSGYIGNTSLINEGSINKHMICYNCYESSAANTKTSSNTCVNEKAIKDCSKIGDGYAKINLERSSYSTSYLDAGSVFNSKITSNITRIKRASVTDYNRVASTLTSNNIVSLSTSEYPTYVWAEGDILYYYSQAYRIYLNPDSANMFKGPSDNSSNLVEIDLSGFYTNKVTNMSYMFANNPHLESLNLSNFDTHNVTNMNYMFYHDEALETLDLSNFDTSEVTNMQSMFEGLYSLESLNISNFDTYGVTNMSSMFRDCRSLTKLDLSRFETNNVTNMYRMFEKTYSLTTVYVGDKWNTDLVTNSTNMFTNAESICGYAGQEYDISHTDKEYAVVNTAQVPGYLTDVSNKGETHTITYPDGTVEVLEHNSLVTMETNSSSTVASYNITLKYHDGSTADETFVNNITYPGNGYLVDDVHCDEVCKVRINADRVVEYDYSDSGTGSTLATPTRNRYLFDGWYTEETGGTLVERPDSSSITVLHAHWEYHGNDLTYDFNINKSFDGTVWKEYDTGYALNWEDDFTIEETFSVPELGQNVLLFGSYNNCSSNYLNVTITAEGKLKTSSNSGSSCMSWTSTDTISANTEYTVRYYYNYASKTYTLTLTGDEVNISRTSTNNKTGTDANTMMLYQNHSASSNYAPINITSFKITVPEETGTVISEFPETDHYKMEESRWCYETGDFWNCSTLSSVTMNTDKTIYSHPKYETVTVTGPSSYHTGEMDQWSELQYGQEFHFWGHMDDNYYTISTVSLTYTYGTGWQDTVYYSRHETDGGWDCNGENYPSQSTTIVTENLTCDYAFNNELVPAEIPQDVEYEDWEFLGWYNEETGERYTESTYEGAEDLHLVTRWDDHKVGLTIDGIEQRVDPGYIYTVPNATPDPYAPVNNKIHLHLYYMDEEDTQKDVVIYEGYSIGYQIINGDTYYPGDTYVVNDETEVVSIYDWNGQYAMDPYIKEPTRDGYIFMGWQLYNWEYYDVSDINVDIYTIEPYYTWFDGASFYAEWQEEPDPDEYVVVRYKDYIKKKDYKKIYPKGYVYTFGNLSEVNPFDVEIRNNVNDDTATVTYTTHITSNSYAVKIVGSDDESWRNSNNWYHPGDTYEINEDIEIEVITSAYTNHSYYDGGCSGNTYLCELAYATADNSRYNNYIFRGVYTEENGQGAKLNPNAVTNNNTYYGSHNGFNTLWVYLEEIDENSVVVTVDGEIFIMPKGEGTIPSPSITSETVNYIITYKFNNGDPDVLGIDTVRYYIGSLDYNGDEYQLGDTFDFEEDTTFWSNWELEPIGDGLLEVNDEHFLGWFDENDNQVTSLDDIEDNITLYAHWDYPDVNVTLEGETDTVPYGFTYDLAGFKNFQRTVDAGTITFHDESGDYEGEVWTTSAYQTPSKAYINGVEYELDGEYTFIEDTVIEFEYEFEFIDEELPRDKSIMGREHYTFGGWYDNPNYEGDPITSYSGMDNIDVYAKWIGEEIIVIINEDESNPLIYHYGDTYTFGDLPESFVWDMGNEIFDFNDGVTPNSTQHLIMTIYPDAWFYYGRDENGDYVDNTYNAGDTVTLYGETWIDVGSEDDNNYVYSGVTIPDDPEREHYTFGGWYNEWDTEVTDISWLRGFDEVITAKWIGEDVTVHLPDEDITVEYGREYPTYENNYPKANTNEATVTFKYHDGETDDYVSYVEKSYTPNGWLINDTHYGEDTIVFTEETTLVPDYVETVIPVEFPSDPTWFRHDFDGWFTEETGGEQVTSYSDLVDTELHAHWHDHMAIITTPDGDVQVDENKQFTFPTNNIPKNNTNVGTIKFDPQNGQPIISKTAVKSYTPNGWLLDGVHYDDGETITVLDDSTITPDYTETISVELPENPIKPNYTFKGWYSAMNGGDKVEVSDMKSAMTVYAHYYETNTEGEEYKLPSNQPVKPTETLATVTFDPHNGDPVITSTVTKKWMAKGWLVDGVQYYNGDVIYRTPDTVIEPNYTYVIVSAQFPVAPTRGNERYTGWYTQETGGEQVKNYEGTEDITLHAHYTDNYALLKDGQTVNYAFCQVSNNTTCNSTSVPNFEEGTYEQYQAKADSAMVISTDDSPYPVYIWKEYPYWYYYTEAETIYFNEDSSRFFSNYFGSVRNINIDKFNSSYVTNFNYFFYYTGYYNGSVVLPLDKLDTSNATTVQYMISSTGASSLDLSNLNTARVVNFSHFLYHNEKITSLDVSHINTSSARDMSGMFGNLKIKSLDVSHFDTSNATDMSSMFSYCNELTSLDLSNFDTSNVTDLGAFISSTTKLTSINLSSFDTSNVIYMTQFMKGSGLREIDLSSFDTTNVTSIYEMFNECPKLEKIWVSEDKWINSNLTPNQGGLRTFYEVPNLIGQRGTSYANSTSYHASYNQDGQYAYNRVDKAPEKPGYFWDKYANKYVITLPDGIEEVYEGAPFVIPTNTYPKNLEIEYTITFDPMNGEEVITSSKIKTYEPAGFTDGENVYESGSTIYVTGDMTLTPYYNEVVVEPDFPEDPIKTENKFEGWYTEGGDKVETLENIDDDITLYAHWSESLPTDFDVDSENITMVVGDTHQIVVTFTPDGTEDIITYTGYDNEKINIVDGLITAITKGETTITIGTENTDIEKTITVTIVSDKLESEVYDVREEDIDAGKDRVIVGAEPLTTIGEFKDNLLNPNEYIKIYDSEGNELDDDEEVRTGLVIKLEYGSNVVDEAIMVIRGDIDGDGVVSLADYMAIINHYVEVEEITSYPFFLAADVDEDEILNMADALKLMNYYAEIIDTLND